jgi:surface protein
MFSGADAFNQPIGNWNVSSVTNFAAMFQNTDNFNQPIGNWNVSSGTSFANMFNGADVFKQEIRTWTVKQTAVFTSMFEDATGMISKGYDSINNVELEPFFGTPPNFTPTYQYFNTYPPPPPPPPFSGKQMFGVNQKRDPGLSRTLNIKRNRYPGTNNDAKNTQVFGKSMFFL